MPRFVRLTGVAIAAVAAMSMLGCENNKANSDALATENEELRVRLADLERDLQNCDAQRTALQDENAELAASLQSAMDSGGGPAGGGQFGGIEGTTVYRSGEGLVVAVAGDVLFDSGQATLKSTARNSLDRIAQVLQSDYAGNMIRVEGYTDSDPIRRSKWASNEHLSAERALAVERHLVSRGVQNDRIYSAAFGPSRPKGSKQASRRVEIVILSNPG